MSYGRNFGFRVPPRSGQRAGRYVFDGASAIPIGAPVVVADAATPDDGFTDALPYTLATGAQAPTPGQCGIAVYEHGPAAFAGVDPFLTTYSDIDTVPVGKLAQLVSGDTVKVWFRNTVDRTFLNTRDYEGRAMVDPAAVGATPTLKVGDYLTPGDGNDTGGYWDETGSATNAWLLVTLVDPDAGLIEARFLF